MQHQRDYHFRNISQDKEADYVLITFVAVVEDTESFVDTSDSPKTFSVSGFFSCQCFWEGNISTQYHSYYDQYGHNASTLLLLPICCHINGHL